jgi:hypothetical protein
VTAEQYDYIRRYGVMPVTEAELWPAKLSKQLYWPAAQQAAAHDPGTVMIGTNCNHR